MDRFIDLLDDIESGLPPLDFDARITALIDEGVIDSDTARKAVRINGMLWEAKRKENLLRALYDISNDLVEATDDEGVLTAVVKRTRALLSSDIAYLSLNDDQTGETYIRTTDGVLTDAFKSIRMPIGVGVLGRVASGVSPAQSTDYLGDPAYSHIPEVDRAVAGEGIRSILGVPLRVEDTVIGVLLVANRRPHRFSAEDISTLASIGSNAAVVLRNARNLSERTSALTQLEAVRDENVAHVRALERMTTLDRRMIRALTEAKGMSHFVSFLAEVFAAPVQLFDDVGTSVGRSGPIASVSLADRDEMLARARRSAEPVEIVLDGRMHTVFLAVAGKRELGWVVVERALDADEGAVLDRIAPAVCVALLMDTAISQAEERLREELVETLVDPDLRETPSLVRRMRNAGLSADGPFLVHVIDIDEGARPLALSITRKALERSKVVVAAYDGKICVIEQPSESSSRAAMDSLEFLALQGIAATGGSSGLASTLTSLADAYRDATDIVRALHRLGRSGEAADAAKLGTASIMVSRGNADFLGQFVAEQVGPLVDYDAKNGTGLVQTALVYLDNDRSLAMSAAELHIHPNTLRQRLNRVEALLGERWIDSRRRLDVHIALRTIQMSGPQ